MCCEALRICVIGLMYYLFDKFTSLFRSDNETKYQGHTIFLLRYKVYNINLQKNVKSMPGSLLHERILNHFERIKAINYFN